MNSRLSKSIIIALTVSLLFAQQWRVPVKFYPTSSGTRYAFTLFFGTRNGASEHYDPFVDIPEPIFPPSGFVAYFVGDTLMPYLREDYRPVDIPGEPAAIQLWQLSFRDTSGTFVSVVWEADSFPFAIAYPIYMQFLVSDHTPDIAEWSLASTIAESESIYIPCNQSVFFQYRDITHIQEQLNKPMDVQITVSPNPFNQSCRIGIYEAEWQNLSLAILDIDGRIVLNTALSSPKNEFLWDASNSAPGIYLVVLSANGIAKVSKKALLIK